MKLWRIALALAPAVPIIVRGLREKPLPPSVGQLLDALPALVLALHRDNRQSESSSNNLPG